MPRADSWGWRARFGILVIHNDAVPESEFWGMAPPGVTIHAARFESPRRPGTDFADDPGRILAESPDIARGVQFFGRMQLDAICLCFGTGSFLSGPSFDTTFIQQIAAQTHGIPVTTASVALQAALSASQVRRPFLVTPSWFTDALDAAATGFLRTAGYEVVAAHRFDLGPGWRDLPPSDIYDRGGQWEVRPEPLYQQVRRLCPPEADGVVMVGNGFRAAEAIAPIEQDLDRPVLTANQTCLWHCLQIAGVAAPVEGCGRLFALRAPRDREQRP